ncbi:MAG: YafY family transcriptional regulator [Chloroflexi bacterium]|nr:YafY family transcriptional regulator [Chloroflexota bacterium]
MMYKQMVINTPEDAPMNRTDRLLAIVLEIQARKQVRAEDLAATFEVSKRTIYRDVMALSESGVPVVAMPGQGYSLVEGYFLPPLSFTTDEAIMLMLGADVVAQNFDAQYRAAAQSAGSKIITVLPDKLRREVEYLQSSIRFIALNGPFERETLQQLRRAIIQRRTVRFRYNARVHHDSTAEASLRDADPYALLHVSGAWMLIAYCHLRKDNRHFRLDRMEAVTILNKQFDRPSGFTIHEAQGDDRKVIIRALFEPDTARWMQETPSFFQVAQEERPEGLLVTFKVRYPAELLNWMLGWGSHVRVLEPASFREMLAQESRRMLENYS